MCGIVGYIGPGKTTQILINGLKRLEYRGYDSAGLCILLRDNLAVYKKKGKVAELAGSLPEDLVESPIGISHTRWATHGEPNEINAHPHLDCKQEIAIVHNGIIENYRALKELLQKEGHQIVSATDSEILAHLIEKFYDDQSEANEMKTHGDEPETNGEKAHKGDLEKAVLKTLKLVEGAFGLAVMHKNEKRLVAARRGSPLVVGVGTNEMFIASDVSAILDQTKRVLYLNDNEIVVLTPDSFVVKDIEGQVLDRKIDEIKWTVDEIEKGGFKHFMLKEIFNQPEAVENSLRGRIKDGKIKVTLNITPKKIRRIILIACGTSWHACLIGKYYLEQLTGLPVEVDYASEFRYRNPIVGENDLVVALSQSGETADTLAGIRKAKSKGATVIGVVNVVGSTIAREVDSGIYVHAGPEIGVASTKAFTCQLVALLLLSLYIRQELKMELDQKLIDDFLKLPELLKQPLADSDEIRELAKRFVKSKNFLYLGRGMNFPVALEGALKLKEISYIHAEGYPAAEMKHGPIALIDQEMPVVFILPTNGMFDKAISNLEEIKARGGRVISIYAGDNPRVAELSEAVIKVPEARDELAAMVNSVPLQLLAYHIADLKRLDVDKPRNLAKSVTVE